MRFPNSLSIASYFACLLWLALSPMAYAATESVDALVQDLSGEWRFALDRLDTGIGEAWYSDSLDDRIQLPGILQAQGYGDEISTTTPWVMSLYDRHWYLRAPYQAYAAGPEVKVPFLSQPRRHYLGAAWYQRTISVPPSWKGQRVILTLERPRWESRVWLGDREVGSNRSLVAPHVYDLGALEPGEHALTIRCDNRMLMDYRLDAHSVSDSLGSSWNGIAGAITLAATPLARIRDVQVYPDFDGGKLSVVVRLDVAEGAASASASLRVEHIGYGTASKSGLTLKPGTVSVTIDLPLMDDMPRWDEFSPNLHDLKVELDCGGLSQRREIRFGIRDFKAAGNKFLLNGREIHLRGTHHGGDFPLTGYPPTDVAYWRKIFGVCKDWGLNHVRFHSWCPPEAAFEAADELGIYLQPECGMWNTINPGSDIERMLYKETERMLEAYGNHPSFMLLSPGNEPKGDWKTSLPRWVARFRAEDPRRLYTTGTGWSLIDDSEPVADRVDYLATHRIGQRRMRGPSGFFGADYSEPMKGVDVPNIVHESGQWCAYPDFSVIDKFTGYLRPGNFEIFRDSAASKGLLERNRELAWVSGKFQLAVYKEEIEANLRSKNLSGFQLLDLHDYIGQGTALVGLLDAFWDPKSYVTAREFRSFCSETVPLIRLGKRIFGQSETLSAPIEMYHYGREPLPDARVVWSVLDDNGEPVVRSALPSRDIPIGHGLSLGEISLPLSDLPAPAVYTIRVEIEGADIANEWRFWLYPDRDDARERSFDVRETQSWDVAKKLLSEGQKVLFVPDRSALDWTCPPLDSVPIFWNRLMGPRWDRMLGLWIDDQHAALASFPTDAFGDCQWIDIVGDTRAINMDTLPRSLRPIAQPIDDWNRNYRLGSLFECRVGPGKLMVSAIDLTSEADRLGQRQLRRSILEYMDSPAFDPSTRLDPGQLETALFDTRIMAELGAIAKGDGYRPEAAIDGDPNTFWISGGGPRSRSADEQGAPHPHSLTIEFPKAVEMNGIIYMPRQNHRQHVGDVREYEISASEDGQDWETIVRGELLSTFEPQRIHFGEGVSAKRLKFTALSGFGGDTTTAVAELAVIYSGHEDLDTSKGKLRYDRARSATEEIDE